MENYGQRPKNYYSNLEKLPNVYLIHPTVSNENLIRNTVFIVTISGSIGLEGIVSKKVFTLGKPHYSDYGLSIPINQPKEVYEYLDKEFKIDNKKSRNFYFSIYKVSI